VARRIALLRSEYEVLSIIYVNLNNNDHEKISNECPP